MLKTAVIIAGGAGTRLEGATKEIPKALVEVGGKPILFWVISWIKENGIEILVLGVA